MNWIAPLGPVYQAGTLSGNPLAMRAGQAMFELLEAPSFYSELEGKLDHLLSGLKAAADKHGVPFKTCRLGGMFGLFFTDGATDNYEAVMACNAAHFKHFFHGMLERGIYLAPSSFEAGFISAAHTRSDLDHTIAAADEVFALIASA